MSDLTKALNTLVSEKDWEAMSVHAGIPTSKLKSRIQDAISALVSEGADLEDSRAEAPLAGLKLGDLQKEGDCFTRDFEVSLFKIVGIKGSLTVCGTSTSDWTAELKVCLTVAGASVWCTSYKFNSHNLGVCFSPNVGLAKAELCFKILIHSDKVCLGVSGKACYWAFGWHCASFDETLFCIPI